MARLPSRRCATDAQKGLLPPPPLAPGRPDHPGEERSQDRTGNAQKEEQELGIQSVFARGVEPGTEVVPHERRTRQPRLEVLRSLVEPIRERGLDPAHEIDVAEHDMRVTVEQPGQKDPVGQIDGFVAVQAGPDRPDPAVLYHHVGGGQRP